jgi:hypothetical protein
MKAILIALRRYPDWMERRWSFHRHMVWPLTGLAFAVLLQWLSLLLQIFCQPCIRTMFEALSL